MRIIIGICCFLYCNSSIASDGSVASGIEHLMQVTDQLGKSAGILEKAPMLFVAACYKKHDEIAALLAKRGSSNLIFETFHHGTGEIGVLDVIVHQEDKKTLETVFTIIQRDIARGSQQQRRRFKQRYNEHCDRALKRAFAQSSSVLASLQQAIQETEIIEQRRLGCCGCCF